MVLSKVKVNCYSGHTYAERPEFFEWQGKRYEVLEIAKGWREPGKRCFLITTADNRTFNLCYDEAQGQWWLVEPAKGGQTC